MKPGDVSRDRLQMLEELHETLTSCRNKAASIGDDLLAYFIDMAILETVSEVDKCDLRISINWRQVSAWTH